MTNLVNIESEYATQIIKYRALVEQGALSQEEYTELVEDLLDLDRLNSNLKTEEDKILIEKVINGLRSFSGLIPKG